MADNKQLLSDFVATAYKDGDVNSAISKFPELKNYDKKLLSDFVATVYNDGDVSSAWNKFPEFNTTPINTNIVDYGTKPEKPVVPNADNNFSFLPEKQTPISEQDKTRLGSFEMAPLNLSLQDKKEGMFYNAPKERNYLYNPTQHTEDTKGLLEDKVQNAKPDIKKEFIAANGEGINKGNGVVQEAEKQQNTYMSDYGNQLSASAQLKVERDGNENNLTEEERYYYAQKKQQDLEKQVAENENWFEKTTVGNYVQKFDASLSGVFGSTFDLLDKGAAAIGEVIGDTRTRDERLFGQLSNYFNKGKEWQSEAGNQYGYITDESGQRRRKDFTDLWKEGDVLGAANELGLGATESSAYSLAAIGATVAGHPEIGLSYIGALSANDKYNQLSEENPAMREDLKIINSLLTGAIEGGSEMLGSVPLGKVLKRTYKLGGEKFFSKMAGETVDGILKQSRKQLGYGSLIKASSGEGIEEVVSGIGQNGTDMLTSVKDWSIENLFEGVAKQGMYGLAGGMQGGSIALPGVIANGKVRRSLKFAEQQYKQTQENLGKAFQGNKDIISPKIFDLPVVDIEKWYTETIQDGALTDIQKNAILDYLSAGVMAKGLIVDIQAKTVEQTVKDIEVAKKEQEITQFVQGITHAESGNVIEARLRGVEEPINITKGSIVQKEDGSVDTENSEKTFFYKTTDGRLHVGNIEFIEGNPSIVSAQEAIDKSIQPVREQLENESAPEYSTGSTVVITDNTDPQNPINAVVKITGRDENGNYQVQRDMGNGQVQPGIVQAREILPQFEGVLDSENAAVDYIDPQTGETKTGVLELDTPDKQMMFANGYATIDGKQIEFENILKQTNNETNGLQATEASNTEEELGQSGDGTAVEEAASSKQQAEIIPQDEKGNLLFEQARPDLTIQFLSDNFEKEEVILTVEARINAINKEITKQETFKPSGNIQKDALAKQAKRQALTALNEQLAYWKDIQERVTPQNYKPKNETVVQRNIRWGEPVSLREMIIRKFIGGTKLRWDDETSENGAVLSRGLGGEYRYSNDERQLHFNFIAANGVTPEQLAHSIWEANAYEPGQFEDMPLYGMDTQDILNEILDVMNSYRSIGDMIKSVDEIRDQYSEQEQAYIASLVNDSENQKNVLSILENEPDDAIFAQIVGIIDLTEEQQVELQNLQNDVTNSKTTETVIGSDNADGSSQQGEASKGNESTVTGRTTNDGGNQSGDRGVEGSNQSAAERDTQELDAYISEQEHNTNPTEKQKETGIYAKARVNLQHHNITIETLKGTERSGIDKGGQKWSVTMQNHYGELDGTVGYDNDPIDVFIGPNPKQGQIFVVDQISPDGSFDESKVMLGFDSAEEAKAAYMSNYSEGWSGFKSITPAGENFKTWLYDGKKQRKPFAEYKETPEAIISEEEQTPERFHNLTPATTFEQFETNVGEILKQYSGRAMGAIQIESYLNQYKDTFGKQFLDKYGIKTREELKIFTEKLQTKVRTGKGKERQEVLKEIKDERTARTIYDIEKMALEAEAEMQEAIRQSELTPSQRFDNATTSDERHSAAVEIVRELEKTLRVVTTPAKVFKSTDEFLAHYKGIVSADDYKEAMSFLASGQQIAAVRIGKELLINVEHNPDAAELVDSYVHETAHKAFDIAFKGEDLSTLEIPNVEKYIPSVYWDRNNSVKATEVAAHQIADLLKIYSPEQIKNGEIDLSLFDEDVQFLVSRTLNKLSNGKISIIGQERFNDLKSISTSSRGIQPDEYGQPDSNATTEVSQPDNGNAGTERERILREKLAKLGGKLGLKPEFKTTPKFPKGDLLPATINIDGVERSTTNSTGKQIHSTEEGIRNFYKWFGTSKVVDGEGRPLVVYHGSISDFNEFKLIDSEIFGSKFGHFFTPDKEIAQIFADRAENGILYETYLKVENPQKINGFFFNSYGKFKGADASLRKLSPKEYKGDVELPDFKKFREQLQSEGKDGVVLNNMSVTGEKTRIINTQQYVVFEPTHIKSATGNNGEFDGNDTDINFKRLDSEVTELALDVTEMLFEDGDVSFTDYSARMIDALGEGIKPYLKGFYELSRASIPAEGMTDGVQVAQFDINNFNHKEYVSNRSGRSQQNSISTNEVPGDAQPISSDGSGSGSVGNGIAQGSGKTSRRPSGKSRSMLQPSLFGEPSDNELLPTAPAVEKPTTGDTDGRGNGIDSTEGHTIVGGTSESGNKADTGLPETFKQRTARKIIEQRNAEYIPVILMDEANIRETLPLLLSEQQDDVLKAENRFFGEQHKTKEAAFGKGMLFTNGTGTGKTYTGLGVAKRFDKQGKKNILIVVPSEAKIGDWVKDGENIGLKITPLASTKDKGENAVITTYANFRANNALKERDFDLVMYDESHRLMEEKGGATSSTTTSHYAHSNTSEWQAFNRINSIDPTYQKLQAMGEERQWKGEPTAAETKLKEKYNTEVKQVIEQRAKKAYENTKVVFLSATPFKGHFNLRYANGSLFDWGNETTYASASRGMSRVNAEAQFFLDNFGSAYEWKFHRLQTKQKANAEAIAMQEIEFSERLMAQGAMSGRAIESDKDYSREFPLVALEQSEVFNKALNEIYSDEFGGLSEAARKVFSDYNYTTKLFESLKASMSIQRIQEHLDLGRKVIIFHRRKQANVLPPFQSILDQTRELAQTMAYDMQQMEDGEAKSKVSDTIDLMYEHANKFENKYADLLRYEQTLNYDPAINQINEAFPGQVVSMNGDTAKKDKSNNVALFNDDNSGKNIIVVQEEAGKEGISLHDTTGKHQRVLISLSLPISSTTALQIEGRPYRIGNESDAIFEYPLLGLDQEIADFGQKINKKLSTTENLAIGNQARDLLRSFAEGVLFNSGTDAPNTNQGKGGKEYDKKAQETLSEFRKAVLVYNTNQKVRGSRDSREGIDYYATPEPIGQKAVEWLGLQAEEDAMEPSAGHGAIAMWFPDKVNTTVIEPSYSLFSKLNARSGGGKRKMINDIFENFNVVNKFNGIAMNPPFGSGGKTAIDHVTKAFDHLRNNGRIVAIIPQGQADGRLDKFLAATPDAHLIASVKLPGSTFEQAGTSVSTRIVVIDRIDMPTEYAVRQEINRQDSLRVAFGVGQVLMTPEEKTAAIEKQMQFLRDQLPRTENIDLSYAENVDELFNEIEDLIVAPRQNAQENPSQTPPHSGTPLKEGENSVAENTTEGKLLPVEDFVHTQTGQQLYNVKINGRSDDYTAMSDIAKKYNPFNAGRPWNKFSKGFLFADRNDAVKFKNEVEGVKPEYKLISDNGFYSTAENALDKIQQERGTKDQFKAMLLKNGAKQAEMDWMGFDELPEKLTKSDIQNWIDENRIEVKEVVKGKTEWTEIRKGRWERKTDRETPTGHKNSIGRIVINEVMGKYYATPSTTKFTQVFDTLEQAQNHYDKIEGLSGNTKFSQYVLPSGENYKELLLTMPIMKKGLSEKAKATRKRIFDKWRLEGIDTDPMKAIEKYPQDGIDLQEANQQLIQSEAGYGDDINTFKSSHYDEENILAHVRFDERTVNGEKVLFIEEFQSDWAQKGKKEGFKSDGSEQRANEYAKSLREKYNLSESDYITGNPIVPMEEQLHLSGLSIKKMNAVPDMPFKKTDQWVNLAVRRMMRYATENGFDRIAWTTGEQQADRYDLSKQVDEIEVTKNGDEYTVFGTKDQNRMGFGEFTDITLADAVGKDLANKIKDDFTNGKYNYPARKANIYTGENLKVGGSGMKAFYDAIVPSVMSKLGKPFGAKVANIDISTKNFTESNTKVYRTEQGNYQLLDNSSNTLSSMTGETAQGFTPEDLHYELLIMAKKYSKVNTKDTVQSIPVTDDMKLSVGEGVPMFKRKNSVTTTPEFYAQVKSLDELAGIEKPVHDKKGGELISDYYKRVKAWSVANNPQAWGEQDRKEVAEFIAGITPESYEAKAQKAQVAAQAAGATVVDEPKPVFQQDGHTTEDTSAFARRVVAWREQRFINGIVRAEREAEAIEAAERGETPIDHEIARMELDMQLRTVYDSLGNLIGKQRAKKLERWAGNKEMWADNLLPVKTFLDFMRSKGMKIPDIDDYYMQATALQGKNDTGFNDYVRKYQKPVNKWIHDTIKKTGFNYRDVENYVFLKHGVERNEFFKKDGKRQKADYAGVYAIAAELYAMDNGIPFDPKEKNEIGKVLKHYAKNNGIELKEISESGIYDELFANKKNIIENATVEKSRSYFDKIVSYYISNFESESNGKGRSIDDFWEKMNAANDFSLDTMADGGIITRTQADEIKSRYKYFIPLRGHEVEAEKTYEYSPDAGVFFSNPAIKAHGRITRAENPFSYVAQMAQSAVVMKNKNDLNKTLLRLARRDKTGLFSVNKTWYIKTGSDAEGNDIWEEAEIEAKPSDELNRAEWEVWNERMKELEKEGRAKQFSKGVDLDGLFIKKKQKKQHAITIIENGEEYQVYINANPRISRAINGLNKSEQDKVLRFLSSIKGMIGMNVTSRNPAFMAANFMRDTIFASSILPAKEGGIYAAKYIGNIPVAAKELVQYQTKPDTAPQYVREFFENGGETGYSHLWELQDMQKQIDKAVKQGMSVGKAWDALMMPIDVVNKIVENTTRMAVYKTSRESGRTVERSISDAKEVSLNFNRKGSGGGITDYVRSAYLFVNAAIQALNNFTKVYKEHPVKMTGVVMSYVMTGLIIPLINSLAGDDDEYWNLPDYERQNNLCMWIGNGFVKIPLPQELRVFYRMGDNIASYLWNKKPIGKAMLDTGAGLLDLIPANPSGAASISSVELVPDAFKPFAQVYWSNKSFTGAAIAKDPAFMKEGVPQWRQVRTNRANEPKVPLGIIWLSAELNAALGGDQYQSAGAFEKAVLNPDKLNHLARGYFGGVYTTATQGMGTIIDRFYLNEKDLNEKTTGGNLQNAYKKIDEAEQRVNQFNTIIGDLKTQKIDTIQFAKDTVGYDFGAAKTIQKLGSRLQDINKTIKENQELPEEEMQQLREAQKAILKLIEDTEMK